MATAPAGREASPPTPFEPSLYVMDVHLAWAVPAVTALVRCVHGLTGADAAGMLGPLQVCPRLIFGASLELFWQ